MTSEKRSMSTADLASRMEESPPEGKAPIGEDSPDVRYARMQADMPPKDDRPPLMADDDRDRLRSRWGETQSHFVDAPRSSVEDADSLVAEVIQLLATNFAEERANLERQWEQGDDVDTEQLRLALQRYRSFFDRLLSV